MNKSPLLLTALALSIGLTLSTPRPAAAAIPSAVPGQGALPSLAPVLDKVLPAVVSVQVQGAATVTPDAPGGQPALPGMPRGPQQFEGLGSGVIIDAAKGYVLTNNHVISQANKISVQLNDGREFDARLIGGDEQSDIALLQLQNPQRLTQIKVADSDSLRVGDFAIAVGNPYGLGQTATSGIISALGRSGLNLEGLENFIQTDASINRGNSGGALLNLNGELIGINTAILAPGGGGGSIGIGFAIPANMALTLAKQLIQFGEVRRGLLGIRGTEMSADIAKAFNLNAQRGAFVSEVLPGSGSAKAGIRAGDVIVSMNGKPLSSFAELRTRIATTEPGSSVKLGLLRNGKPMEVTVTLDKSSAATASADIISPALQGATLGDGKLKDGSPGIRIDAIDKDTPAAQSGLKQGDIIVAVNRYRVRTIADMRKLLANKPAILALRVVRGDDVLYLLLQQ
ncbi:serine endoprotease DegQ [Shimwellia blattae]|uniref:peptidase Do n=1 Tax=Shimwellia blattae (strain ATCC 29907 / DSM 4481 / JCM 1650 / NBRC 105725 / CDC 9005-74) TaxID=630626 RepID=I2B4N1_SHIBC|nr:serine endoprotease DegQ [Shimwellia blattae]AFJ45485.1 serine peptidase DegQ [Shimwellia blattae DSM 4481 = NBRC 105725]GAB81573.1 periplasmic serine endoprotease DegQ [Shimwellia blattae DSM 4481 = NBRC 105725]VDY62965.1 Periplasmic pH-dependent serine endoprotease DegQ precursor [Shimwellia blattae]VEC20032.1 Periplasmic pH-dependent serine endoprotease DegQ precursor [Shimwellia blattae]